MKKKNKSGLWNAGFGEIGATLKALENAGVTLEHFSRLRSDKELVKKIADLLKKANNDESFSLVVDHSKTVEQAIAEGHYNCLNDNITVENFGTNEVGISTESAKLFHFNRDIGSTEVASEMDKTGYRSAVLVELLALGAAYPKIQRQFPILALGSAGHLNGFGPYIPSLYGSTLDLCLVDNNDWLPICRFLGVKKR